MALNGWWSLTQNITDKSNEENQRKPEIGFLTAMTFPDFLRKFVFLKNTSLTIIRPVFKLQFIENSAVFI